MTGRRRLSDAAAEPAAVTLDQLVEQACDLERQLAARPTRRMSADAFVRACLERAHAEPATLDAFEARLPEYSSVGNFVAELARLVEHGHVTDLPKPGKEHRLTTYAGPTVAGDLAQLNATAWHALAAAVRRVAKRWPDKLGALDDLSAYDVETARLRDRLDATYAAMPAALRVDVDVDFDQTSLTNPERDRGLALVKFRRWPGVALAPDWPHRLVRAALAEPATEVAAA